MDAAERELGAEVVAWIDGVLRDRPLGRALLERLDLDRGRVVTWLPADVSPTAASNFQVGITRMDAAGDQERSSSLNHSSALPFRIFTQTLADSVRGFLSGRSERLCLFEDPLVRARDEWLRDSEMRVVTLGDTVYYVATARDVHTDYIERAVDVVSRPYPPLLCVFTRCLDEQPSDALTQRSLEQLAEGCHRFAVGAYDGEGYVLWKRRPDA